MGDGRRPAVRGWRGGLVMLAAALVFVFGAPACGGNDDSGDDADGASTAAIGTATRSATTTGAPDDVAKRVRALEVPAELVDGLAVGKKDAPAILQVFEDFQCPNCLFFTITYEQLIVDEYVKTGKLRYEFHNFPILGEESVYAGMAAVCAASQEKFWELHEKLFLVQAEANQLREEKLNVGRFSLAALGSYAKDSGLDQASFNTCMQDPVTLQTVQEDFNAARAAGLRGTPGFVLDGTAVAYPNSADAFRTLLDAATKR